MRRLTIKINYFYIVLTILIDYANKNNVFLLDMNIKNNKGRYLFLFSI